MGRGDHFLLVGTSDVSLVVPRRTFSNKFLPKQQPTAGSSAVLSKWWTSPGHQNHSIRHIMQLARIFLLFGYSFLTLTQLVTAADSDEPIFELPVQLIGFPIIIAAVRITNFLKKLTYALNPDTYVNRVKRAHPLIHDEEILDVGQVEKKLVAELGNNVCIYERICTKYAERTVRKRSRERVLNWGEVFSEYRSSPNPMKENYLLSVFLGDIIGSPKLCHLLAKRGRACDNAILSD